MTLCETVGYGDQINKEDSFKSIVDYIDNQFEAYLQEELKIKRSLPSFHDTRIHSCLYFITPNGHGLKSLDLVCMKKLDSKVNIIPVIAKADTVNKQGGYNSLFHLQSGVAGCSKGLSECFINVPQAIGQIL